MSYDYPTILYPIGADVTALATLLAQRQSGANSPAATPPNAGVSNGGIVATDVPAVPDITVNTTSAAYFKAMADAILARVGFIGEQDQVGTSNQTYTGTGLTNYVDITVWPAWTTPAVAVAGRYVLHCHLWFSIAGAGGAVQLRTVVDGTPVAALPIQYRFCNSVTVGNTYEMSWVQSLTLSAATHAIRLQVGSVSGTNVVINTDTPRRFLVRG